MQTSCIIIVTGIIRIIGTEFEEWSTEVTDRADNVFKGDTKDGPIKDRENRIKEMDEVIKKDLE